MCIFFGRIFIYSHNSKSIKIAIMINANELIEEGELIIDRLKINPNKS